MHLNIVCGHSKIEKVQYPLIFKIYKRKTIN